MRACMRTSNERALPANAVKKSSGSAAGTPSMAERPTALAVCASLKQQARCSTQGGLHSQRICRRRRAHFDNVQKLPSKVHGKAALAGPGGIALHSHAASSWHRSNCSRCCRRTGCRDHSRDCSSKSGAGCRRCNSCCFGCSCACAKSSRRRWHARVHCRRCDAHTVGSKPAAASVAGWAICQVCRVVAQRGAEPAAQRVCSLQIHAGLFHKASFHCIRRRCRGPCCSCLACCCASRRVSTARRRRLLDLPFCHLCLQPGTEV